MIRLPLQSRSPQKHPKLTEFWTLVGPSAWSTPPSLTQYQLLAESQLWHHHVMCSKNARVLLRARLAEQAGAILNPHLHWALVESGPWRNRSDTPVDSKGRCRLFNVDARQRPDATIERLNPSAQRPLVIKDLDSAFRSPLLGCKAYLLVFSSTRLPD